MTNNEMVTLNIYNHPPQLADDSSGNINETNFTLNTDKPQINQNFYDNTRNGNPQNYNSAPRIKYPKKKNNSSSIDESSSSTDNNPDNAPVMQQPIRYPQFQQPIYQQVPVQPVQPIQAAQPVPYPPMNPMISPYNTPYGQPVVVQQRVNKNRNKPVNNAPKTIIIREREPERRQRSEEECCAGFLAGCAACLTCCCLMGLCCPGPHGPHGHHRGW